MSVATDPRIERLVSETSGQFLQSFGGRPVWVAAAPGRVNLIGEHVDYNDGFVLPMAVDRYTVVAGAPAKDAGRGTVRVLSRWGEESVEIPCQRKALVPGDPVWANYIRGVMAGFLELGAELPALDLVVGSDVPVGAGLSSSAALEVACATVFELAAAHPMGAVEKSLLCQRAEHSFAGVPCGIMDQMTATMAKRDHLLLIDCRSREVKHVPFPGDGISVLVANTNVQHELADGEYEKRRRECTEALEKLGLDSFREVTRDTLESKREALRWVRYHRALHVVTETARTMQFTAAVVAGEWERAGEILYASHASLRDDYEVSCPELDAMVEIARGIGLAGGVYGCRMTGGGFGGATVSLVDSARAEAIGGRMAAEYRETTGIDATVFCSRPACGARVLEGGPEAA